MRALLLFVVLVTACSFSPLEMPPDAARSAPSQPSQPGPDASASQPTADAPGDAPAQSTCSVTPGVMTYNGHHYVATALAGTWQDVKQGCVLLGGHLVKIDDGSENDFIASTFVSSGYVWIGLSGSNGSFTWTDGTTPGYTNFGGNTNVAGTACVDVDSDGNWSPYDCTYHHVGICECE